MASKKFHPTATAISGIDQFCIVVKLYLDRPSPENSNGYAQKITKDEIEGREKKWIMWLHGPDDSNDQMDSANQRNNYKQYRRARSNRRGGPRCQTVDRYFGGQAERWSRLKKFLKLKMKLESENEDTRVEHLVGWRSQATRLQTSGTT